MFTCKKKLHSLRNCSLPEYLFAGKILVTQEMFSLEKLRETCITCVLSETVHSQSIIFLLEKTFVFALVKVVCSLRNVVFTYKTFVFGCKIVVFPVKLHLLACARLQSFAFSDKCFGTQLVLCVCKHSFS